MRTLFICLILVSSNLLANINNTNPAHITPSLLQHMKDHPKDLHRIRVEFKDNVDCYGLNQSFKDNKTPISERKKTVIRMLMQQANKSQASLLELINAYKDEDVREVQSFWVTNIVVMEASTSLINQIRKLPEVNLIDAEYNRIQMHDPIIPSTERNNKTANPNGIEPGLAAINAPKLWAMGYTGKGTLVYNYDTGVWPTHPAYSDRFLAHRLPLSQSWIGFFSDVPNGTISDHGTHTLGTIAGLDRATSDTIGVAFNAYWIANDYVTSTVEELPPLTNMIEAFEWALNPDGDTSTVHDIPDVINNSWRWLDDPDTVHCGGFVVNLMNAIEAAGIANIFSGGNSGPDNTTVNSPQRINTSEVNTFSVGSINGNVAFPHPISTFSTLGPTQCAGTGSLAIHPEVVAPGQNVRSAWGTDEYNSISGTSMAAPHVSGAVLLLKEAFPDLSGEDLLWALYNTAIDLGDTGEDNTFGKGIIDVYAAYQELAMSHTPRDPNQIKYDLAISEITSPVESVVNCDTEHPISLYIKNHGDTTVTSATVYYYFKDEAVNSFNWSGTLNSGDSVLVNLPAITTTKLGELELITQVSSSNNEQEYDIYNNYRLIHINRIPEFDIPFSEDFENGFANHGWALDNPDNSITWDTATTEGLEGTISAALKHYRYDPAELQRDGLITPQLILPADANVTLEFDISYQMVHVSLAERLIVSISSDCGNTYSEIFNESEGINTHDTIKADFVPWHNGQWETKSLDISDFAGNTIVVKFETENKSGNNLYLDNVLIYNGDRPLGINSNQKSKFQVYPNPTENIFTIKFESFNASTSVQLLDLSGRLVRKVNISSTAEDIDITDLNSGIYLIEVRQGDWIERRKIVKK